MFLASRGGGQDSLFRNRFKSAPCPRHQHLGPQGLDAGKYYKHAKYPSKSFDTDLVALQLGLGAELSWVLDINLDRAGVSKYLNRSVKSRSRAQPEMVADWPPERERTHAVSDICAVVYMVLVKCVWMPTLSYSCRLWNATKSRDVLE